MRGNSSPKGVSSPFLSFVEIQLKVLALVFTNFPFAKFGRQSINQGRRQQTDEMRLLRP